MIFSRLFPTRIWTTALALSLAIGGTFHFFPSSWGSTSIQPRTSNTTETNDDRIGQLFYKNDTRLPDGSTLPPIAICSASHIGNGKWVTAAHCLSDFSSFTGHIKQSDGESATVTSFTVPDRKVDIAVLTVGQGIEAGSFDLPSAPATPGEKMSLIGFADERDYASQAEVEIEERIETIEISGKMRKGGV
ncbi:trypsin-like serine protease [Corynebacterium sp. KPL2838]|uniref:trypsin-like serine protease n=1 Tax=Corynebacterium sp. KPL2838 TaxID=3158316 RepID=UPI0032EE37DF